MRDVGNEGEYVASRSTSLSFAAMISVVVAAAQLGAVVGAGEGPQFSSQRKSAKARSAALFVRQTLPSSRKRANRSQREFSDAPNPFPPGRAASPSMIDQPGHPESARSYYLMSIVWGRGRGAGAQGQHLTAMATRFKDGRDEDPIIDA
jgi:hypothetical protein